MTGRQVEDKNQGERGTCPHLIRSMVLLNYMRSSPFLDLLFLILGPLQHTAPLTSVPFLFPVATSDLFFWFTLGFYPSRKPSLTPKPGSRPLLWSAITSCTLPVFKDHQCLVAIYLLIPLLEVNFPEGRREG